LYISFKFLHWQHMMFSSYSDSGGRLAPGQARADLWRHGMNPATAPPARDKQGDLFIFCSLLELAALLMIDSEEEKGLEP
jgi:hypothetical protein